MKIIEGSGHLDFLKTPLFLLLESKNLSIVVDFYIVLKLEKFLQGKENVFF